jgi:hypothetical protein
VHSVGIILGMGFGICSLSQAQMGGMGGGMPTIPGMEYGGATDPSSIRTVDRLILIPSVQVSERYDSNVFLAPKSQLQGVSPDDIVTTVMPQVRGLYADREKLVKVNVVGAAVGSYYMNNSGLSYVGANGGMVLDMSDLVSQWRPGAIWTVSDTFFYSPQPPAFLLGGQFGEQVNPLVAGFQATRSKTTSNSVNTMFQFPLNRTISLAGSYTKSFIHYGASQVQQAATLINQDVHAYTAGLLVKVSLQDDVTVDFMGNEFDQGGLGAFSTRGGGLGWTHRFSPTVSFNAVAGVQVLSGESSEGRSFSEIAPVGRFAMLWQDTTTFITLAYRSGITPSFQFRSAAMLNHSVSFNMTQNTPIRDLAGLFVANYSVANGYGSNSGGALSWTTVGGTAGLLYRITEKTFLTLTYSYQNVDNVFGGARFAYDKHVAQLNLTQAFY